jgi:hypothetical protein
MFYSFMCEIHDKLIGLQIHEKLAEQSSLNILIQTCVLLIILLLLDLGHSFHFMSSLGINK